jgi:hypothetical protein
MGIKSWFVLGNFGDSASYVFFDANHDALAHVAPL